MSNGTIPPSSVQNGQHSDSDERWLYWDFILLASLREKRQQRTDQESLKCKHDFSSSLATYSSSPLRASEREKMSWEWIKSLFKRNPKVRKVIEEHREISEKIDEEMFRLKATLDGEEGWFRQEGHRNDRKSS